MLQPSYKKQFKKTNFYERDEQIKIFNKELQESKQDNINILMFYGIGGIGKTTLLNHLYNNNTENNLKIFINLEEFGTPLFFYSKLMSELSNQNIKLMNLKIAYSIYWSKLNPNLPMKKNDAFKGEWESLVPIIDTVGFCVGSIFKVLNDSKEFLTTKVLNNYKKELEELEDLSAKEIEILLPKFLNYDLVENMKNRNETIIFFFDTYEFLFENNKKENNKLKCDSFIRDMILSTFEVKNLFILAGREKLIWDKEDDEWSKYISHIEVNSISKGSAINYLKDNGVKEEVIIKNIISYTECVPFYLSLELNTYLKLDNPTVEDFNASKTKKDIFNRFITYADNNELQLLKVISFTKKFNLDLFEKIIKEFNIPVSILVFNEFVENSYVKSIDDENFSLHSLMKKSIQSNVNNVLQNKINNFLFNYYSNDLLEQIDYALNIFNPEEILNYLSIIIEKENLKDNYFLIKSLYEKVLNFYSQEELSSMLDKDLKSYMLIYVNLGLIYIKLKEINEFNDLNKNIDLNILNEECKNLKIYLYFKYILSGDSGNYEKTIIFSEKINKDLLPYNFKIDFEICIANFIRQHKKLDFSLNKFNLLSKEINENQKILKLISQENLLNYNLKLGYLYKDLKDYDKSINYMNIAKTFVKTEEDMANVKRGLSLIYGILGEKELFIKNIIEVISSYNKIYGNLNYKTLMCYKSLIGNNCEIDDKYFQIYKLLENKDDIIKNYDLIKKIIIKEENEVVIINLFTYMLKLFLSKAIFISVKDVIKIILSKITKEKSNEILLKAMFYYKNFDIKEVFDIANIIYKNDNNYRNFKLLAESYNDFSLSEEFLEKFNYEFNNLNIYKKEEILISLGMIDEVISLSVENKNMKTILFIVSSNIENIISNIEYIEKNFNNRKLDIVYSYIISYYEKRRDIINIEKYLLKQLKIRQGFNLPNLSKAYGFLANFYLKNNETEKAINYYKMELSVYIKDNNIQKIGIVEKLINKLSKQ